MNAAERRHRLSQLLNRASEPLSAAWLAAHLGVSRQVIVGDVALLRAQGLAVQATPRGYLLSRADDGADAGFVGTVVCRHAPDDMMDELQAIVRAGGYVRDVVVDHPLYGQLTGQLQIGSEADVEAFLSHLSEEKAQPLSTITDGVHLHTIRCADRATFERIRRALDKVGVLYHGLDDDA